MNRQMDEAVRQMVDAGWLCDLALRLQNDAWRLMGACFRRESGGVRWERGLGRVSVGGFFYFVRHFVNFVRHFGGVVGGVFRYV